MQVRTLLVAALFAASAATAMADEFERIGDQTQKPVAVSRAQVKSDIVRYEIDHHLQAQDRGETGDYGVSGTQGVKLSRAQVKADIVSYEGEHHLRATDRGETGDFIATGEPAPKLNRAEVVASYRASNGHAAPWAGAY